ncbi:CGG triplet repeat-binding protein 1-like [Heterodontus francisci]|uniref:CGG triplet repeat-binding protein 1-like n=1 Tax=Heterodontus francisci TaxID=7792 RepID=UPI00355B922D
MSKSKMVTTITSAHRVKEFGSQILHANGGILFCTSCNVLLVHIWQATIQCHLASESHHSKKRASGTTLLENKHTVNKQRFHLFLRSQQSSENHQLITTELVDAFARANIQLEKLDHQSWVFIQHNVQNGGCLLSASKLRQRYQ